jgi:NAD(P)-dependent dehydrogenase (short-subunit alcohol dehydrogenase family)
MDIGGRNAFVTGAASGIGLALCRALAEAGANVVMADLNDAKLAEATASVAELGVRTHGIRLDVTDRDAYERAADEAERVVGPIHLLANNAGIGFLAPLKEVTYADWDWVLGVNLGGTINGVQSMLPRMLAHGEGGHIVSTASAAGLFAAPLGGVYVTAKMAVVGYMEVLRHELAVEGIGVSVLCPHLVRTQIYGHAALRPDEYRNEREAVLPPGFAEQMKAANDTGMEPAEVAAHVIEAIRANRLYIITHPELRQPIEQRFRAMLASIAEGAVPADRLAAEAMTLSFGPYEEILGERPDRPNVEGVQNGHHESIGRAAASPS